MQERRMSSLRTGANPMRVSRPLNYLLSTSLRRPSQPLVASLMASRYPPPQNFPFLILSFFQTADAQWTNDDKDLIFVGLDTTRRRLGHCYCTNRASAIYKINLFEQLLLAQKKEKEKEKEEESIKNEKTKEREEDVDETVKLSTPDDMATISPRLSPNGNRLIYFSYPSLDNHNNCARLRLIERKDGQSDFSSADAQTIVDIDDTPAELHSFPGFYFSSPGEQDVNWLDDDIIVFASLWRSIRKALIVDIPKRAVEVASVGTVKGLGESGGMGDNAEGYSWKVHASSRQGYILAAIGTPNRPDRPVLGRVSTVNVDNKEKRVVEWTAFPITPRQNNLNTKRQEVEDWMAGVSWEILQVAPSTNSDATRHEGERRSFEAVVVSPPATATPTPLLVIPHGGPHSCYAAEFSIRNLYFVSLGYKLLLGNLFLSFLIPVATYIINS